MHGLHPQQSSTNHLITAQLPINYHSILESMTIFSFLCEYEYQCEC